MKFINNQKFLEKLKLEEFPQPEFIQLRHPVLLCHGYGAIASIIKPSPMHEPGMLLRQHGIVAFAPNIVPYAKIETRSLQWVEVIEKITDRYGFEKLNVIAHSMAGLDMRYALTHTDIHRRVASLTTLATPHHGTSLAELVLKAPEKIRDKLAEVFNWYGNSIYPKTESDSVGAIVQLTRDYVQDVFNPANPDREDLAYFSFSASVGKGTDEPVNPIYLYQNQYILDQEGPNDTFVSEASAQWGTHLERMPLSHLEQIKLSLSKDRIQLFETCWVEMVKKLSEQGY